jgi:trypsin
MMLKAFLVSLAAWQVAAMAGGRSSNQGEFPGFVGVVMPTLTQVCGATIFNRNHVLTVASCMLNANNLLIAPNQISIISGDNTIDFGRPRTPVLAIYVHPQFNPFTFENDIAVVRTQIDFAFPQVPTPLVAPVQISTRIGRFPHHKTNSETQSLLLQLSTLNPVK